MTSGSSHQPSGSPLELRRLLPAGSEVTMERLIEELASELQSPPREPQDPPSTPVLGGESHEKGERHESRGPYVLLNMVATSDGRATLAGRSGGIGGAADKQLFHGLRTVVDAVMVGAGTIRAERYRRLVREEQGRQQRCARGLDPEPLACIVSGRLALDEQIPLLADPDARVAILTASQASLPPGCSARIDYVRASKQGVLDLQGALTALRRRFGVRTLLCEGGPHLNANLLAEGLVDELFLSVAPTLAGGDTTSETLRIVVGRALDPPAELELLAALEHESHLFLRYRVAPPRK